MRLLGIDDNGTFSKACNNWLEKAIMSVRRNGHKVLPWAASFLSRM
jgi:hypothetical protein